MHGQTGTDLIQAVDVRLWVDLPSCEIIDALRIVGGRESGYQLLLNVLKRHSKGNTR